MKIETGGKKIVFIDCETTGVNISKDKIIQIAAVRFNPETGKVAKKTWLINPEMPIPADSTAIHGITDEMVKDSPTFPMIVMELKAAIEGCVLAGYNIETFDIPLLRRECYDSKYSWEEYETIDVFRIVKVLFSRTLSSMYERYTGKTAEGSHDAFNDCVHAFELLSCMLEKDNIPASVKGLNEFYYDEKTDKLKRVDSTGNIVKDEHGLLRYNFGKHKGKLIIEERDYATWMITSGGMFANDTIEIIKKELK